jgi:predicted RNA-binding protein with PIN domain
MCDDKIDVGLEAFDKLVGCLKQFPKYDLNNHLEIMYTKDIEVFKYFINRGVNFVETYPYDCESESDSNNQSKSVIKGSEATTKEIDNHCQKEVTPVTENPKMKKQNRKSKQKRNERLLKLHQQILQVNGLPPSRLMLQQQQTPRPQPNKGLDNIKGKN